ncbi:MAG: DUF3833 domain-containing protein [Rhodospirillales bacterium]|nr:DUF3833 domain-containing protein [Rhodospirillales bacterium]MBO6786526.1 DUF3833 domain-containing protein [Rhodospirillales bacterium]
MRREHIRTVFDQRPAPHVAAAGCLLIVLFLLTGCSMKVSDFSESEPAFRLEEYFSGKTQAWGLFEDRFGKVRRQFVVDITGTLEGDTLVLDERFKYADGETDRRVWRIRKLDDHRYEGRADDIIGTAQGESYGNALNWSYDMDLKIGDSTLRVHFDDWMFLQPGGVLLNRATVSKWGLTIGEVTLAFAKPAGGQAANDDIPAEFASAAGD